jgi:hypothetical protein
VALAPQKLMFQLFPLLAILVPLSAIAEWRNPIDVTASLAQARPATVRL